MSEPWRERLARRLVRGAAQRLGPARDDWARAMAVETEAVSVPAERLRWAIGCAAASHRAQCGSAIYPAALTLAVLALTWQQWSADEGPLTCALLALASLGLGLLDARRVVASGVALGSVVAGVHVFGAVTGVRPPYETHDYGVLHGLMWAVLVAPALIVAWAGAQVAAWLEA